MRSARLHLNVRFPAWIDLGAMIDGNAWPKDWGLYVSFSDRADGGWLRGSISDRRFTVAHRHGADLVLRADVELPAYVALAALNEASPGLWRATVYPPSKEMTADDGYAESGMPSAFRVILAVTAFRFELVPA